jgi:BirA family transcriptional regulator, biotin operon repressor / biotin---[acetyl-CoA-carboxylase] ligase
MNIDVARLQKLVGPDVRVAWQSIVTSTNALLMDGVEWVGQGPGPSPRFWLLGADEQTAGRGRRQRPWISQPGSCATFSVRLPPFLASEQAFLPSLPLALGVAVVDAINQWAKANELHLNGSPGLKWPNDVLCDGKKVAGVLVEARGFVVAGVGINLVLPEDFQKNESLATSSLPAGGLLPGGLLADGATLNPHLIEDLVARVASLMVLAQAHHRQYGLHLVMQRWNELHVYQGQAVCLLENGDEICRGVVQGIRPSGELLVLDGQAHLHTIVSGDLSLRLIG